MATDVMDIDLDGMVLPVANEENKSLEIDVQRKQKLIGELDNKVAEYNERVDAIKEHMKNVRQELQLTQVLMMHSQNAQGTTILHRDSTMPEKRN